MPETKFLQAYRKVKQECPEMFTLLEEYDKTRRLRKITYKERANFTIDARILRQFRTYCQKNGFNMSKLLENCMKEKMQSKA
jgi:hypothetical protein